MLTSGNLEKPTQFGKYRTVDAYAATATHCADSDVATVARKGLIVVILQLPSFYSRKLEINYTLVVYCLNYFLAKLKTKLLGMIL